MDWHRSRTVAWIGNGWAHLSQLCMNWWNCASHYVSPQCSGWMDVLVYLKQWFWNIMEWDHLKHFAEKPMVTVINFISAVEIVLFRSDKVACDYKQSVWASQIPVPLKSFSTFTKNYFVIQELNCPLGFSLTQSWQGQTDFLIKIISGEWTFYLRPSFRNFKYFSSSSEIMCRQPNYKHSHQWKYGSEK